MVNAQEWLDQNYPSEVTEEIKKRENIIYLNINRKNLEGDLKLEGFINLKKLDCSFNQLTSLDLSGCSSLTHLNCSWNKFPNPEFLKTMPSVRKLEILKMSNNEKLKENLSFLVFFEGLIALNIENCPFYGSLEPLKDMKKLKKIFITNTDVSEGLEYLPDNCQEFYCNTSEYKYKSIEIVKELTKYLERENYYNVSKWQEDKQSSLALSIISSERLFVIRSNMKQFVNKWGKKEDEIQRLKNRQENLKNKLEKIKKTQKEGEENLKKIEEKIKEANEKLIQEEKNWKRKLGKFSKWIMRKTGNKNELSKLQSPKEIDENWWTSRWSIYTTQSIGRGSAIAGAIFLFQNPQAIGAGIATIYPLAELIVSNMEKSREFKESKWKEFLTDADDFLDNCNELLGILDQFEIDKLKGGEINKAIKDLNKKITGFLDNYDEDDNKEIDVDELISEKELFIQDLDKWDWKEEKEESELQKIVNAIKKLERVVIEYRRISYYGKNNKEENIQANEYFEKKEKLKKNSSQSEQKETVIDLDEHFTQKRTQISTSLKRRKSISQTHNKKNHELVLQAHKEEQTEATSSSSEYNSVIIQIIPK